MTKIVEIVDYAHTIFKEPSGIFRGSYHFLMILLRTVETSSRTLARFF